ncbi:hypothetical protein ACFL11_01330 [Patescibacteria group bacterium]
MNQKIKKVFFFTKTKKSVILGIFCLTILGLVLPIHPAWAAITIPIAIGIAVVGSIAAWIVGQPFMLATLGNLVTAIVITMLQLPLLITNAFLSMAIGVLYLTTTPGFISLSYTNPDPTSNKLLWVGWTLTRDLTNMAFVIALIAIGLGTALKIGEYSAKKTLPLLIIIALLVNFSPVLLGLIVDASNIIMNFFLADGVNFDVVIALFSNHVSLLVNTWGSIPGSEWQAGPLAKTIALIFFGFVAGLIFLAFAFLFILRYIAIWMLVILSPLAFFCYILPATRRLWNMWWNQFIQWCFIGVFASFFLYLSMHLADVARPGGGLFEASFSETGPGGDIGGLLNSFLPYGVVIGFMIIGLFTALSTSAMGASGAISVVQKRAKTTGDWTKRWVGKTTGTAVGRRAAPAVEKWGERLAERGRKGETARKRGLRRLGWGVGRRVGTGVMVGAGRVYRQVKTSDENDISAGKREAINKDSNDNFRIINEELVKGSMANWNRITGVLLSTVANGDSNDIQAALRSGKLSGETLGKALLLGRKRGGPPAYRPLAQALYGRLLSNPEQFGREFKRDREDDGSIKKDENGAPVFLSDQVQKIVQEIPEKLKSGDIAAKILGDTIDAGKKFKDKETGEESSEFVEFGGKLVLEQLIQIRGGDLASGLIRRPETKEGRKEILETIQSMSPEALYAQGAGGLIKYLASNAAQGAGIVSPLTQDDTSKLLKLLQKRDRTSLDENELKELQDLLDTWAVPPRRETPPSPSVPPDEPGTPSRPRRGGVTERIGRTAGGIAGRAQRRRQNVPERERGDSGTDVPERER